MRPFILNSILFLLCFPAIGISQGTTSRTNFYLDMGVKDATHELSLTNANLEDERDFWLDQKAFEALLKKKNPLGYQSYLDGKHSVYRNHQIHCGERCDHSTEFSTHMAFYLINGNSNSNAELVLTLKKSGNN